MYLYYFMYTCSNGLAVDVLINEVTSQVESVVFHYPPTDINVSLYYYSLQTLFFPDSVF